MTSSLRNSPNAASRACCLWVDLRRGAASTLADKLGSRLSLQTVHDPAHIPDAIRTHAPRFFCFEFDRPDAKGLMALALTRRHHPGLPVLMLTGFHSEAVALWALRLRVWDVLVKPVAGDQLMRRLAALVEATRQPVFASAFESDLVVPPVPPLPHLPHLLEATAGSVAPHREGARLRTQAAIDGVAAQFSGRIALERAAALCRLSTSRFCRVFRQEHGVSFGQYVLRYRIERACESLAVQGALAKQVAYSVGFNDLSYFSWAFKRQTGVCPSQYQAQHDRPNA
jgi:two-component system, response regulator YesN